MFEHLGITKFCCFIFVLVTRHPGCWDLSLQNQDLYNWAFSDEHINIFIKYSVDDHDVGKQAWPVRWLVWRDPKHIAHEPSVYEQVLHFFFLFYSLIPVLSASVVSWFWAAWLNDMRWQTSKAWPTVLTIWIASACKQDDPEGSKSYCMNWNAL